jgi:hypothetical protein
LIIEPLLKKVSFLRFSDYKEFIAASKEDDKIEIMSEVNNMYRTLCSLFCLLLILELLVKANAWFPVLETKEPIAGIVLLMITFAFSYRKQTQYIVKRVKVRLEKTAPN